MTNVIQRIRRGDEGVLEELYLEYREDLINWLIRTQQCDLEEAKEIFQITIVVFFDNVVSEKLTELKGTVKSYLFGIGKNKVRERRRQSQKASTIENHLFSLNGEEDTTEEKILLEQKYLAVERGLHALGNPCKQILELFYYFDLSMEDIGNKLNYKNTDTVKTQKYKCIQRLRKLMQNELSKTEAL